MVERVIKLKTNQEVAIEVIDGKWGNNYERQKRLEESGYDYTAIQSIVNSLMADPDAFVTVKKEEKFIVRGTETLEIDVDLDKYNSIKLSFRFGGSDG